MVEIENGKLNDYLADIDRQAQERSERLIESMCERDWGERDNLHINGNGDRAQKLCRLF